MSDSLSPRIYVACLASYNAGKLHGAWIDANQSAEDIQAEITEMLKASPEPHAEEYAIHDYEDFGGLELGEHADIETVAKAAAMLAEHGPAYAAYANYNGLDYADNFEDAYRGEWKSEEDYAESLVDEGVLGEIPEALAPYIDYEKFARDLFIGDVFSVDAPGGMIYVFDRNV